MGGDLKAVSRRAAERGHWRKPWEEEAGQETSAGDVPHGRRRGAQYTRPGGHEAKR